MKRSIRLAAGVLALILLLTAAPHAALAEGPGDDADAQADPEELERRRARWTAPEPRYRSGVMAKYARLVSSASTGAVTG